MAVSLTDQQAYRRLVAAGNDLLFYEDIDVAAGTMTQLAASDGDIDTSDQLNIFEAYGKVFVVNGSNLKVADFINVKITTTDIKPAGKVYPLHGDILTGGTSTAKMVVDYINASDSTCTVYGRSITVATFSSGETVTGTNDGGDVEFTTNSAEANGPHWYDWTVYANDTTVFGTMPNKAYVGCLYHGRCFISSNPEEPQNWYATRLADPWDFAYASNDTGTPVYGSNVKGPGEIGDVVRAVIPIDKDQLTFGCANSIEYMQGDPAKGGEIMNMTNSTGMFGANSWCRDNKGIFYFWGTTGGIWAMTVPGIPECISLERLPKLLKDEAADPSTHRITMGFDATRFGIIICITLLADGTNSNYWFDLRTKGFFPETYPEECGPYSIYQYAANDTAYTDLLVGCKDGYIRKFDDDKSSDDIGATDEAIDSYAVIGPFPLSGGSMRDGMMGPFELISAGGESGGGETDPDNVTYYAYANRSAAAVIEDVAGTTAAKFTGTIVAPGYRKGQRQRKRARGRYGALRFGNLTAGETWSMETADITVQYAGKVM